MTQSYPLGRLHAPDVRDHLHLMAYALPAAPVARTSIAYRRGPILNQGNTPSCVGHAWRNWLNGAPIRQKGGPSAMEIYHQAQKADEWPGEDYDGTSVRGGAKFLQSLGIIGMYVWAFDEPTVRQWMLSGKGGVIIGINWYDQMFSPDAQGYVTVGGSLAGGHAIWLRRYDSRRDAYEFPNSWDVTWGLTGQAWLRAVDLDLLLHEDGEACCGVEVRV